MTRKSVSQGWETDKPSTQVVFIKENQFLGVLDFELLPHSQGMDPRVWWHWMEVNPPGSVLVV